MSFLVVLGLAPLLLGVSLPTGLCGQGRPHLVLATKDGSITAELFEAAAPHTLRRLADLIKEEHLDSARGVKASGDSAGKAVTFDYTHAHVEIYTGLLKPEAFFENELDAEALKLDVDRVGDAGKAMDIFQREIVPAFNRVKKSGNLNPRLRDWMTRWRAAGDAGFLVGASRKEINEAQGYVYAKGLDSRPVTKGALILQPDSPTRAKARLGIALSDLPTRLGRQMVIGRVVGGLDLADDISIRPLAVPAGMRSIDHAPRDPVVIESLRLDCRE